MRLMTNFNKLIGRKGGKLEQKWELPLSGLLLAPPAIGDMDNQGKSIVFGTKEGSIHSVDENGNVKWKFNPHGSSDKVKDLFLEESGQSIRCTPLIVDINNDQKNEVIIGTEAGILYILDNSGNQLSRYDGQGAIRSLIAQDIDGDNKLEIIFSSVDGIICATDGKKAIWKFKAESGIESRCTIMKSAGSMQIIFGSNDGVVYSLDMKGKLIWKFKTNGKITAEPALGKIYGNEKEYILIGSHDNNLYALDEGGNLQWKYETEGSIYSKAALADINNDGKLEILFGSCDDNIYVLSCDGKLIWNYETDFWVIASPLAVDLDGDNNLEIVAGSYDKSLYVLGGEASFKLNYMPGISGITQQTGSYSEIAHAEPAKPYGKPIWKYKSKNMIISAAFMDSKEKNIIIGAENSMNSIYLNKQ